jgi:hypothetical protein
VSGRLRELDVHFENGRIADIAVAAEAAIDIDACPPWKGQVHRAASNP